MNKELQLYYNKTSREFTIIPSVNTIKIYDTHNREGFVNGRDEFVQDQFRFVIQSNFYPKSPKRQYVSVNIYINEVLLLPLSMSYRPNIKWWRYNLIENIFFSEYNRHSGKVIVYPKAPSTIVQLTDDINWEVLLLGICDICNNYREWISNEVNIIANKIAELPHLDWRRISEVISMMRIYDKIAPDIITSYHPLLDNIVLDAMKEFCEHIKNNTFETERQQFLKKGEVIWQYIKDYIFKK